MRTSMLFARNLPRRLDRAASNPFLRSTPAVRMGNPASHGGYAPKRYSAAARYNPRAGHNDNYAETRVAASMAPCQAANPRSGKYNWYVHPGRNPSGNPPLPAPQFARPFRYAPPGALGVTARLPVPPALHLAAPQRRVPGEICWWTGFPNYAKCCSYEGLALPVCVTYPDVE